MTDMIPCPTCRGKRKVELTGVYADTLRLIRELCEDGGYVTASKHHKRFRCKVTALSNRLRFLNEQGFLSVEKYGRERRYSPV